jgi:hypothetical protein
MPANHGHFRAMQLLPFAAAAGEAGLMLKRQAAWARSCRERIIHGAPSTRPSSAIHALVERAQLFVP